MEKDAKDESVHDAFVRGIKEAGLSELATTLEVIDPEGKLPALSKDRDEMMSTLLGKEAPEDEDTAAKQGEAAHAQSQRKRRREIVTGQSGSVRKEDTPPSNLAQRQITAAHVLHAMREAETISYTDLASQMIDNVREALAPSKTDTQDALRPEEERSLRRHIYDVVNVLIAMGLVEKDQNMLTWTAVPQSTEREFVMLDKERRDVLGRIADKQAQLRELMLQTSALHNLAQRNKKREQGRADASKQVALPFVVVTTDKNAVIECEMAESRNDIVLNMSEPFKIHDDTEVLKRLKLHLSDADTLRKLFPKSLHSFIPSLTDDATKKS